jgi:uncharacterized membrane protein YadS
LVVGSAQSGAQIAEELYESGRKVYLATGRAGRTPRRYRGKDANWWFARMLLPTVFAISLVVARKGGGEGSRPSLPLFLVGFALLVSANTLGLLPRIAVDFANDGSRWCLVAAIAALGMKTSFKNLFDAGFRPLALMVAETLWIGALVTISVVAFM